MTENPWRNAAYHESAHAVVAHALRLIVNRVYIGEEENTGRADIQTSQDHLPREDRIAVWAAAIAAKPIFNFEMDSCAERADVGHIASLVLDLDENSRASTKEAGYRRAEELLHERQAKVLRLAEELIVRREIERPLLDQLLAD
jgi:ATP-dependent Zn protease